MPSRGVRAFRFEEFEVDLDNLRILRDGDPISIRPSALRLLVFLIENRHRLVTKEELHEAVWEGVYVTDNALTRAVARLRESLDDDPREPRFVETAHGLGYRFLAEVESLPAEEPTGSRTGTTSPEIRDIPRAGRKPRRATLAGVVAIVLVLGAAAIMLWTTTADEPAGPPDELEPRQLTTSQVVDDFPSLSPDGSTLAFARLGDEAAVIVAGADAGSGQGTPILDGGTARHPAWSPDGRTLAFENGGIWLVPAVGGAPRQLTDFGFAPAWSPDGTRIVFQTSTFFDRSFDTASAVAPSAAASTLWIVEVDGAGPRQLTRADVPVGGHVGPAFSPDGSRIAFVAWTDRFADLWTMSPDGTDLRQVDGAGPATRPAWAPDASGIYYGGLSRGLWWVPISGRRGEATGEPVRLLNWYVWHVSVSADGSRMAFSRVQRTSDLWSVAISEETGSVTGPPVPLTRTTSLRNTRPIFAPDGSRIAFQVLREGSLAEIWLVDPDGGNREPLISEPAVDALAPVWLDDGHSVVFIARQGLAQELRSVHVDTRRSDVLLELDDSWFWPRVSPDGRHVAFHAMEGTGMQAWVAPLQGGAPRRLWPDPRTTNFPVWSPDGEWLAFSVVDEQGTHVGIGTAGGDESRQLTTGRETRMAWANDWSPDVDRIAFAGARPGDGWNIYWVSRGTGEVHQVTDHGLPLRAYVRHPAWSPRGGQIVYELGVPTNDIYVVGLDR